MLIAGVNALGWTTPPFLVLKAKNHDKAWYRDLRKHWRISISDNVCTTNKHDLAWLKHFIKHIEGRRAGSYMLLVIDGHESHKSLAFHDLCNENKIITLGMSPHASNVRQPLGVGLCSSWKRAYGQGIGGFAEIHVKYMDKKAFLASLIQASYGLFSEMIIQSNFKATGEVLHNSEAVLLKPGVKPRTTTPSGPGDPP